jgi:hypothetical protein
VALLRGAVEEGEVVALLSRTLWQSRLGGAFLWSQKSRVCVRREGFKRG